MPSSIRQFRQRLCRGTLVWLAFSAALAAQINLLATPRVPTGGGPRTVVAADLNGDSKADLVAVNSQDNTVSVSLSNGDGTFQPVITFAAGSQPYGLAVADFNHDGKPDLAVTDGTTKAVSVLLGNGDGTFQTAVNYPASDFTSNVVVADFNGDGKPDLAVTDASGGIDVLLGNGDGTFNSPLSTPTGPFPFTLATGDFNGDGKADLAVVSNSTNLTIFLGNGDGTFTTGATYTFLKGLTGIAAADLNLDGKLDLVEADSQFLNGDPPAISVMLGNGDGTFSAPVGYGYAVDPFSVVVADFNGDGKPDAAVTDQVTNAVRILIGKGDGTFLESVGYATGLTAEGIAAGDFNGDGKIDLATANYQGNDASILLGQGDGTFRGARTYDVGLVVSQGSSMLPSVVLGDFTGDEKLDVATSLNGITLLLGNGDGSLQAPVGIVVALDETTGGLVTADLNHDGHLDLAATTNMNAGLDDRAAAILLGNGDGTFQETDIGVGQTPFGIALGDFNSDGNPDLAVGQAILQGDGSGSFLPLWSVLPGNQAIVSADFNLDGKADLLVYDTSFLKLGLGNGDNTFQWTFLPGTFDSCSSLSTALVTADFNADGIPDLALACSTNTTGYIDVLLGNGDGTFQSPVSYPAGFRPQSVAVANMNLDGHPDLIVAGQGTLSVLSGNGDGTFQPAVNFDAPGSSVASVAVGDLNGDGLPDVVLTSIFNTGLTFASVTVMLNQTGIAPVGTVVTLSSSLNPSASGENVTLAAGVVSSNGSGAPSGTVTFHDGSTVLGSATLSGGAASLTTSTLSVASHNITATYSGDTHFLGTTSSNLVQMVNATDFVVAATDGTTATVSAGQIAQYSLVLTPGSAQSQTVALSCSGAPAAATCTVSPASLTLSGTTPSPFTVSVQTAKSTAELGVPRRPYQTPRVGWYAVMFPLIFAGVFACGAGCRRRIEGTLLLSLILLLTSCGGGSTNSGGTNGTQPGTYSLMVTAQSSTTTQHIQLMLTVQ